jgi:hypothetical protein
MSLFGKTLVLVSLLAILIATAAAQVSFASATPRQQHAGCHQPAPKTPAPASYSCCQAGHDSLLLLSGSVHSSTQLATITQLVMPTLVDQPSVPDFQNSASPPGESSAPLPLRV